MKALLLSLGSVLISTMAPAAELPNLIAHRGASHVAPENTLAAFKLAWKEGADGIEGDFRLTLDGEVVCIHDKDTKRVSGRKRVVAKSRWATLAGLDVGSWKSPEFSGERIPRLADVLEILPEGKRFFLEIKSGPEIVEPIRRILAEQEADPRQVVMICFDAAVVAACREKMPAFPAHWISKLEGATKRSKQAGYLDQLRACDAGGLQFKGAAAVDAAWLASLRGHGFELASWTVDDLQTARRLAAMGVQNLTTNRPGPLRAEWLK